MPSFMNGLSALGAGVSAFAGTAGLEAQKADLARQNLVLADQLATTRESAGRQEAGGIAAKAAEAEHGFLATQGDLNRQTQLDVSKTSAGATLGSAAIQAGASKYAADMQNQNVYAQIAALAPGREQEIMASQAKVAFEAIQTKNASDLRDLHTALAAENAQPNPDPGKLASLTAQITASEKSAATETAVSTAAVAMMHTDMDAVTHFNTQLVTATSALNAPGMSDTDRNAQKGLISDLQKQLAGAQRAYAYSSDLAHGRLGGQAGVAPPTVIPAGNRPPLGSILTPPGGTPPNAGAGP